MTLKARLSRYPVLQPLMQGKGVISLCLTCVAIILASLAGPYLAVGEVAPLEPAWVRTLIGFLLILGWCVYYGMRYVVPGAAAEVKNAHELQVRQFREARRIRRALLSQPLFRKGRVERRVWWINGTPDSPSADLGLTGQQRFLAESPLLGLIVMEQAGCRFLVRQSAPEAGEDASTARGEAVMARVLFGNARQQPDAMLFSLPVGDLQDAEASLWMRLNRINDALAHLDAVQVPLYLNLSGLEAIPGSEVIWRDSTRECLGFGLGRGAGQWLHDFTRGAQQVFERIRFRAQHLMSEEMDLQARIRAQHFLTGIHESLSIAERIVFRIMNETTARRLAPLAVALDRPAERVSHWTQHPLLGRMVSFKPAAGAHRARRVLEGSLWAGALAGCSAIAVASWQDFDQFKSLGHSVADKIKVQPDLDRSGGIEALVEWSDVSRSVERWITRSGILQAPSGDEIEKTLEQGYQLRLVRHLAPVAEAAWLNRLNEAPSDIRHLSRLSKALGSLSGQTDWSEASQAFWSGLPELAPVNDQWLTDLASLKERPAYERAHAALRAAMAAIPLEEQVMARLFDEEEISRFGSVGVDELLGGKARTWIKSGEDVSIPRFYTSTGYHTLFAPRLDDVLALYREEAEAIQGKADAFPEAALRATAEQAYAERVGQAWKRAMTQIRLRRPDTESLGEYLLWLGSESDSPVRHLLQSVSVHTDFALSAPGSRLSVEKAFKLASMGQGMTARVAARAKRLGQILAPGADEAQAPVVEVPVELKSVQMSFDAYREWLGAESSSGRWQGIATTLSTLGDRLQAMEDAPASERYAAASEDLLSSRAQSEYRRQLREARALPEPMRAWVVAALGQYRGQQGGYVRQAMQTEWKRVRSDWKQMLQGRYPFDANGEEEVPLSQLTGLFGPQGTLNRFYDEFARPFVEETPSGLKNRKGAAGLGFSAEALRLLNWARIAKETLFDETGQFRVEMTWRPQYLDANLRRFEMDLNDEAVIYRHGPLLRKSVVWQGGSDAERTRIQFVDYNGLTYHRSFDGAWSLHRLLMKYRPQTISAGRYKVDFEIQGRRAVYELGFRDVRAWQLLASAPSLSMGALFR